MAETKKLKIGILTFHYAHNYGAVLQCYALQQTLMKFCPGADISVVNYKNQKIKDGYKFFPLNTKNPYRFLRSVFGAVVYFYDRVKRTLSFYNFVKEKLSIGSSCLNSYDVIFYGSDQIWNPLISTDVKKSSSEKYKAMSHGKLLDSASVFIKNSCLDKTYLGQGFNGTKIAYGASDGNKLELTEDVKKMLDSFSSVSVREKTLAKKLALLNKGVSVVCDPVFLLSKEDWLKNSVVSKEKNYIFAYKVAENARLEKSGYENLEDALSIPHDEDVSEGLRESSKVKIFLYICTLSPVSENEKSVWFGGEEVRKSVIEDFAAEDSASEIDLQLVYDSGREMVHDEEMEEAVS